MRQHARAALFAVMCLLPNGCADDPASRPGRTANPAAVSEAVTPKAVPTPWGQQGEPRAGVTVQVSQPVEVSTTAPELRYAAFRTLVCDVLVHNDSLGSVRVGLSALSGRVEVPPLGHPSPALLPGSSVSFRRILLAPLTTDSLVIQVSATVDGLPVPDGWRFSGGIG